MKIEIVGPDGVGELGGLAVVIDVLRAFTTAAHAFGAGASSILMVASIEDAFALREERAGALLVGEEGGYPIAGFDLCNSPFDVARHGLDGAEIIMRTTAGTRAVVAARGAEAILAASFVCAEATVRHILRAGHRTVHLVASGRGRPLAAEDDLACADYLAARLRGERPDPGGFLERVRSSPAAHRFLDRACPDFQTEDLELALELDRFDFAMAVRRQDRLLVLEKAPA